MSVVAGLGLTTFLLALTLPVSQTSWIQVLTVSGTVNFRALQGCSVGFWKQSHHFDSWPAPYLPDTPFEDPFDREVGDELSLLEALEHRGGGLNALTRQSAAALLNAASGDIQYAFNVNEVVTRFQAAFDSGDYEPTKDAFDSANQAGCPLNGSAGGEGATAPSPSPTNTETATATATPQTPTPEASATPTPAQEQTQDVTPTSTSTPPSSATALPDTPTGSPTATTDAGGTVSPTGDSTASPTATDPPEATDTPTPTASPTAPEPDQGCPAEFWADEVHHVKWPDPYAMDDIFQELFDRDLPGEHTLLELLEREGSDHETLTRETVAALLNAASSKVDYPLTEESILANYLKVLDGAESVPVDTAVERLESYNTSDCPWPWPSATATETPLPTTTPTSTPPPTATSTPES